MGRLTRAIGGVTNGTAQRYGGLRRRASGELAGQTVVLLVTVSINDRGYSW